MYGLHTAIASYDAITHSGGRGSGGRGRDSSQKAYTHTLGAIAGVGMGMGMGVTPVMTAATAAVASSGGFTMPWLDHATTVRIDIHPDGRIVYAEELPGRSAAWLSLDGICFMVSSSTDTSTTSTTSTFSASATAPTPPTTTTTTTSTTAIMRRRLLEGKVEEEMKEEEEDSKLVLDRKVDLNGTLFRWNGSEVSDHAGTIQNDINSSRALVYGSVGNE